jgi:hypothetical protein
MTRPCIEVALAVGGSISGTVTDESTGEPLFGLCVGAVDTSGGLVAFDITDLSGAYSISGLAPAEYKVAFAVCFTWMSVYQEVFEWYDDKADFDAADLVPVTEGMDTGGIDAALAVGSISGTVTDASTSDPLSGIDVCVYRPPDVSRFYGCVGTDGSGEYTLKGLPSAGDYKIKFRDPAGTYATEWYDDKGDLPSADLVSVSVGAVTTGIDGVLGPAGSILGTVTYEVSGDPLADIEVCAFHQQAGPGAPWTFQVECGTSDALGAYSVGRLATGNYEVKFRDPAATYGFEWYNDQDAIGSADIVSVTGGADTPNINAALPLGGCISGMVTDEITEEGLPGIRVCPIGPGPPYEFWPPCFWTDDSGTYSAPGLRPGDYLVGFHDPSGTYSDECYDDNPDPCRTPDPSSADPVPVAAGGECAHIDAALRLAGLPVGGIAELPLVEPEAIVDGSDSSVGNAAALAGGLAVAVLATVAGAWYARRRWLR